MNKKLVGVVLGFSALLSGCTLNSAPYSNPNGCPPTKPIYPSWPNESPKEQKPEKEIIKVDNSYVCFDYENTNPYNIN